MKVASFNGQRVEVNLDMRLSEWWHKRVQAAHLQSYKGWTILKLPDDLMVYEQLLFQTKPDTIIELGSWSGGSALWFHDRLAGGTVISVDILDAPRPAGPTFIKGDLTSSITLKMVRRLIRPGARVMVVDDSEHTYGTTLAALRLYSPLVTPGCYFVVEDGAIDVPELRPWGTQVHGVLRAIDDFLAESDQFEMVDWNLYGVTQNVNGYLERRG